MKLLFATSSHHTLFFSLPEPPAPLIIFAGAELRRLRLVAILMLRLGGFVLVTMMARRSVRLGDSLVLGGSVVLVLAVGDRLVLRGGSMIVVRHAVAAHVV